MGFITLSTRNSNKAYPVITRASKQQHKGETMNKSFMIILLGVIITFISIAQIYACAMTAVVCQGDYTLIYGMVDFGDGSYEGGGESLWL